MNKWLLILVFVCSTAVAQKVDSLNAADWSSNGSWSSGLAPQDGDTVIVPASFANLISNVTTTPSVLIIRSGAIVILNDSLVVSDSLRNDASTFTLNANVLQSNGDFTGTGSLSGASGGTLIANGAFEYTGSIDAGTAEFHVAGNFEFDNYTPSGNSILRLTGAVQNLSTTASLDSLIIEGGGVVTLGGTLDINGGLRVVNNSTLVNTTFAITVEGDWDFQSGTTYTPGTSTVTFNENGDQDVAGTNFYNVTFTGHSAGPYLNKNLLAGITVANDLTIQDSIALNGGTFTHQIDGDWFFTDNGRFNSTGTVLFTMDFANNQDIVINGTQTVADTVNARFYNVTVRTNTPTRRLIVTADDTIKVENELRVEDNSILRLDVSGHIFSNSMYVSGIIEIYGVSDFIDVADNTVTWERTASLDAAVNYLPDDDVILPSYLSGVYDLGLYLDRTFTLAGNLLVQDDFTVGRDNSGIGERTIVHGGSSNVIVYDVLTIQQYDSLVSNKLKIETLPTENSQIAMTDAGGVLSVDTLHFTVQSGASTYRYVDLAITGTNASLDVNEALLATNPNGSSSVLFSVFFDDSYLNLIGGSNSLIVDDYAWLSFDESSNARNLLDSVETVSFSSNYSGIGYNFTGNDTIATSYNHGSQRLTYTNIFFDNGTKVLTDTLIVSGNLIGEAGTFIDNGHPIYIAGDFGHDAANTIVWTNTIYLNGADQTIADIDANNIVLSGTGTKTIGTTSYPVAHIPGAGFETATTAAGGWDILGDLTIEPGVTFNALAYGLTIQGNWTDNGTFSHSGNVVTNGTTDQVLNGSFFGLQISNSIDTVWAGSDITVTNDFDIDANATFADSGKTIFIGNLWDRSAAGNEYVATGTVNFNGGSQTVTQSGGVNPSTFNNVIFSGSGTKNIGNTGLIVLGDVTIEPGVTVDFNNFTSHAFQGNFNNTGSIQEGGTITLNGGSQNLNLGTVLNVVIAGTNAKKTLTGNATLTGDLTINATDSLDASSFTLEVRDEWTNNGTFVSSTSTVTFGGGNAQTIITGSDAFYNLTVNKSGGTATFSDAVTVSNDFTHSGSTMALGTNDISVGGDFIVSSTLTQSAANRVTLNATSGTHSIEPGSFQFPGRLVVDASGATYQFAETATISGVTQILNGTLALNSQTVSTSDTVLVSGGTLNMNKLSVLSLGNDLTVQSAGTLVMVGVEDSVATLSGNGGNYTVNVDGSIQARYYAVDGTNNGIDLDVAATVDATNNFSNGTFSNGVGAQYLVYASETGSAGNTDTLRNVAFNSGPTNNVTRSAGTDTLVFVNSTGTLSGDSFENDGGAGDGYIKWVIDGYVWNGGTSSNWNLAANWTPNGIPTIDDDVQIPGATPNFPEVLTGDTAYAANVTVLGNTLTLTGSAKIYIAGDLTLASGTTLAATAHTDTLHLQGDFNNAGTATLGVLNTVQLYGSSGSATITSNGTAFNHLELNGNSKTWTLQDALDVNGDFTLQQGTLDVSTNNYAITVAGNWTNNGTLTHQTGTVTLDGTDQSLGGTNNQFYDLNTGTSGTKTLTGNLDINDDLIAGNETVILDAQTNDIYLFDDLIVSSGTRMRMRSDGNFIFDGTAGTQSLEAVDTLNNVIVNNSGGDIDLNGDMVIKGNFTSNFVGAGQQFYLDANLIAVGGANVLTMNTSGELRIRQQNFPNTFETFVFNAGTDVYYEPTIAGTDTIFTDGGTLNFANLTIVGTAGESFVADGDVNVSETFNYAGSGDGFDMQSNTLTAGNFATVAGLDMTSATFNYAMTANRTLDIDLDTVKTLNVSGVFTLFISDTLVVMDNLTIGANSIMDYNGNFMTSATGGTLTQEAGSFLLVDANLPQGFSSYNLNASSTIRYNGVASQIIDTSFEYANIQFDNGTSVQDSILGNIVINGNLQAFGDAAFFMAGDTMFVGGDFDVDEGFVDIDFGTSTIVFDGNSTQTLTSDGGAQDLIFYNAIFRGSGTKALGGNDDLVVLNDLSIAAGVTLDVNNEPVNIAGDFTNNGSYTFINNQTITFDGSGQTIDPGSSTYDFVVFSTGGKTIVNNGFTVAQDMTIQTGVTVDFTSTTTTISDDFTNSGNPFTSTGTFVFDGTIQQDINFNANDTLNNLTFTNAGFKNILNTPTQLVILGDFVSGAGTTVDFNAVNPIFGGNVTIGDQLTVASNITLTGAAATTYSYQTNNEPIGDLTVSANSGATYQFTGGNVDINGTIRINSGRLDLNAQTLVFGNAATDSIIVNSGGIFEVDSAATLSMDDNTTITVNTGGQLDIVGDASTSASISVQTGTDEYGVYVLSGATVNARYYNISNIDSMYVESGATVGSTNNFSDGSWSNGEATGGYLVLNHTLGSNDTIRNVQFNTGPVFNIARDVVTAGGLVISNYSGAFGGDANERDPSGQIEWLAPAEVTWTGATNNDWFTGSNWNGGSAPDSSQTAIIPSSLSTYPQITSGLARAGGLTINSGANLVLNGGNLEIGSAGFNNSGILVISGNDTIYSSGDFVNNSGSTFSPGSGSLVDFNGTATAQSIDMSSGTFNNVRFSGSATVSLASNVTVSGNLEIVSGANVDASTSNFDITVAGDWNQSGTFTFRNGDVTITGSGVTITNGSFYNLNVNSAGAVTNSGTLTIDNVFDIQSGTFTAGDVIDINGTNDALNANPSMQIQTGATFNDNGLTHTIAGGIVVDGTFADNSGTLIFDGVPDAIDIVNQTTTLNNVIIRNNSAAEDKRLSGNLTVKKLRIEDGDFFTFSNNLTGTDSLIVTSTAQVVIVGSLTGFTAVSADYDSEFNYQNTGSFEIIAGTYGRIDIEGNGGIGTLAGNIIATRYLLIGNNSTLDVDSNFNYGIEIQDDFDNNNGGIFRARQGTVTITSGQGTPNIYTTDEDSSRSFYNVVINTDGVTNVEFQDNIRITNDLTITAGVLDLNNNQLFLGGNFTNSGTFTRGGGSTIHFVAPASSSRTITSGGDDLDAVTINSSSTTYTLTDYAEMDDGLTITAGTLDLNGQTLRLGDNNDAHTINGTMIVDENATLEIYNNSDLTVGSGGSLQVVGTSGNTATVTNGGVGTYNLSINGTIAAQYYTFEYMSTNGVQVNSTATIDATNNFSNGTFTNGASGGTLLRIENTQTDTIQNVSFPANPGGGASNVTKSTAVSGDITFQFVTGEFSGSDYENDPNNLINWPDNITLTWDGSAGTDWYTAANWTPSSGPDKVPDSSNIVIIPNTVNQPVIGSGTARTFNLTINASSTLTLNGGNLEIDGETLIDGTLLVTNATDTIVAKGNWTRNGTFTPNGNSVIFEPTSSMTLNNGTSAFYNLTIGGIGSVAMGSNLTVTNNLMITSSLSATATDYDITVGGNWTNSGTYTPFVAQVTFNGSSGTYTIDNGSSDFYDLIINASGATYQIGSNDMSVTNDMTITAGTVDLDGNTLNFGDGIGDNLNISGILIIDENATLAMGDGTAMSVGTGGTLTLRGTDDLNPAAITRQSSGTYTMNIAGTVEADYYTIDYVNATGVHLESTATVSSTYNFSNGTFSNGTAGGRYMLVESTWPSTPNDTLTNVTFNSGPDVNVRRVSGSGTMVFKDAQGVLAGVSFEDDNPDGDPSTGRIHWAYSTAQLLWTGATNTDWHTATNWTPAVVPDSTFAVTIPDVSAGSGNNPVIDTLDALTGNLTINSGATLTIQNSHDLLVGGSFSNDGTMTISSSSVTTVAVFELWSNSGTLNSGNASTVSMKSTGTASITSGGDAFYNLTIDSTGTITLGDALTVTNDLTLNDGSLDVSANDYSVTIAGDYLVSGGAFDARSSTVTFNGASAQSIVSGGTNDNYDFYNVVINGAGIKSITTDTLVVYGLLTMTNGDISSSDATPLYLAESATLSGGSDISYVDGPVIQAWSSTGAKVMPLGKNGNYRPLTVTFSSASSPILKAEVFEGDAGGSVDGTLTAISDVRYYQTSLISGSGTGTIGIRYGADDKVGGGELLGDELNIGQSTTLAGTYTSLGQSSIASSVVTSTSYDPTDGDYIILGSVKEPELDFFRIGSNSQSAEGGETTFMATVSASRRAGTSDATWTAITVQNRLIDGSPGSASDIDSVLVFLDTNSDPFDGGLTFLGSAPIEGASGGEGTITFNTPQTLTETTTYYQFYFKVAPATTNMDSAGFRIADANAFTFASNATILSAFPLTGANDISLPVKLVQGTFTANRVRKGFEITAETATENNVANILIQRATRNVAIGSLTENDWTTVNTIASDERYLTSGRVLPTTLDEIDPRGLEVLRYRIVTEELDGTIRTDITDNIITIAGDVLAIRTFELQQNYPNPFNPTTTIRFNIPYESQVSLLIYNSLGQKVRTLLLDQTMQAGTREVSWNGLNDRGLKVASGMYFYRLVNRSSGTSIVRKMILLK